MKPSHVVFIVLLNKKWSLSPTKCVKKKLIANAMSRLTNAVKKNVAANQQWKCQICSLLLEATYEIDHVIPKCKGGTNDENNLQALCPNCHRKKTRKDISKPATKKPKISFPPGYATGMPIAQGWAENYIETHNKKINLDRYKSLNVDELRVLVAKYTGKLDLKKTKKEMLQIMDGIKSMETRMFGTPRNRF